jgi:hypothetical protein
MRSDVDIYVIGWTVLLVPSLCGAKMGEPMSDKDLSSLWKWSQMFLRKGKNSFKTFLILFF